MHLDPEAGGLAPLVRRHAADPDLHQPEDQPLLHDPGERARVGVAVAVELIVQVGVGVHMQQGEPRVSAAKCAEQGIRDRMITPEREWPVSVVEQPGRRSLDGLTGPGGITERKVARVVDHVLVEIAAELGGVVGGRAGERLADDAGRLGRSPEERRAAVVRQPEQRDPWHLSAREAGGFSAGSRSPPRASRASTRS